ncbi:RDD family protein [Thalassotalea crassostreae]|uniref:RDD family protein n=1 Tax=Thalassotalea crassostreae TaxID=1763536 RepID=UPI0008382FD1|nr:RDD family protein [Thalassotalea crassostreae]
MKNLVYANVWQRMMANVIDGVIIVVPSLILSSLAFINIGVALISVVFSHFAYSYYGYYFHGKYGATFGKHFLGIMVLSTNYERIDFNRSFKRSAIDIGFSVIATGMALAALVSMDFGLFAEQSFFAREAYYAEFLPAQAALCATLFGYWLMSELLVMLLNKKCQGIQDMLAGTIVVVKPNAATHAVA